MPRRAFVHIGTHKTGTTFLQNWWRVNRRNLSKLAVCYPQAGLKTYDAAHKDLSHEVRTTDGALERAKTWSKLKAEIEDSFDDVVISAETFSDRIQNNRQTQRIVDFFSDAGMQTVFVVFFRDVPAYLNSRYVQSVKNLNTTATFAEFAAQSLAGGMCNYPRILKPFEDTAKVIVLPYTRTDPPIERAFLKALGRKDADIDRIKWKQITPQNQSLGPLSIHLARMIAEQLPDNLPNDAMFEKRKTFKRIMLGLEPDARGFVGCDMQSAENIRLRSVRFTDPIAEKYFQKPWHDVVPPEEMFRRFSGDARVDLSPAQSEKIISRVVAARPTTIGRATHSIKSSIRRILT